MRKTALALMLLLAACANRPPEAAPAVSLPAAFSKGATGPADVDMAWWQAFNDPELNTLVARALAANLDLQGAAARVRQARWQEAITRGGHGPQVNASAQVSRADLSKNALPSALTGVFSGGAPSSGSGIGLAGESFSTYQAGFDASWELDLFGGQRSADRAAHVRLEAAVWSQRDAEVTLAAEVANNYQQYRSLQRRAVLAAQMLATQQDALDFLQVRARNGLVSDPEVRRQQQQVEQAGAEHDDLVAQADTRVHALGALLDLAPEALAGELASPSPTALALVDVPPGLPSELLKRRPDIRAAERQLAAATADVGVATADLYPKVTLTGALQLASRSLSDLVESDSRQDNVSARLSLPLLNRGRLHAAIGLRQAQADAAALTYRQTVRSALREVEDALTRLDADRHRLQRRQAQAAAAKDAADTAAVQSRHGLIAAAEALTARLAWQGANDDELQAEAATAQDMVALYKALGGGWDQRRSPIEEDKQIAQGS